MIRKQNPNDNRVSVSAEVYGEYNKQKEFKAPIHPKEENKILHIVELLNKSVLFQHLDNKEKRIIALAMEVKEFEKD